MFSKNRYGNDSFFRVSKTKSFLDEFPSDEKSIDWTLIKNNIHLKKNEYNLIQQHPLPDVEKYYNNDQFYTQHVHASEWFNKERLEFERGLWNSYFDYLVSRMNPNIPLLDVGCGAGWFVDYWNKIGKRFFAYGIEPSELARKFSASNNPFMFQSKESFDAFITEVNYKLPDFNILMSLVLEHIPDPVSFIQQYIPYMGKTGTLTIVVPNDFNPLQKWLGSTHFIQDVHVNYFTPDSLLAVIYEALPTNAPVVKYEIKESSTFPMEIFELLGFHYIENGKLGRKCHNFRLKLETLFGKRIFKIYEKLYDKYNVGRELIFTVKRI